MRTSLLFLLVCISSTIYGQQEPQFALTQFNFSVINPAYVGSQAADVFTLATRSQWSTIEGSPKSYAFTYNTARGNNIGLGLSVLSDKTFVEQQTFASIDFSYKLQFSEVMRLYLGLKVGGSFYKADLTGLQTFNNLNDPSKVAMSKLNPNIGIGAYLEIKNSWVSLSSPRLVEVSRAEEEDVYAKDRVHLYAAAGTSFTIVPNVILKPSLLVQKVKGLPIVTQITAQVNYLDRYDFGAQLRNNSSMGVFGVLRVSDLIDVGYAYETYLDSGLSSLGVKTHELFLRIKLSKASVEEPTEGDSEETSDANPKD